MLALLIVAFIPIGYFGYRDLQDARSSVPDQALKTIFINSITRAKDIERTFLNAHSDINYLRSNLVMEFYLDLSRQDSGASSYWRRLMEREFSLFLAAKRAYSRIGLMDEYGNEVAVLFKSGVGQITALKANEKRNRITSPYYVNAAKLGRYGVAAIPMRSSVEPGMNLNALTLIRYATKVFDSKGEARGVLFIDLNGSEIFNSLSLTTFNKSRKAAMVTMEGNYIYNPYFKPEARIPRKSDFLNIEREFSDAVVAQILSGKRGVISDDSDSLFAYSPIYPQVGNHQLFYVVFDRYSKNHFIPRLNAIKKNYLMGAFFVFLLCIAISVVVSQALTRKLAKLGKGVENIRKQRLDYRLDIRSGDEIESLAKAYNMMAGALQEYSESLEKQVEERSLHIKKVERKLMQAEKLAAIGFLAAGVAHEINNPISIIVTRLEIITKSLAKGDTKGLRRDLDVLHKHATRIAQITGSLLTFSRESSDKSVPVDINMAVEHVMGLIEPPIITKGIRLNYLLNADLPRVLADGSGMEQVIYNIVYNAYQATDKGGSITIRTGRYGGDKVELVVTDTGGGIPKDIIDNIFEPFFTTKEQGQGSGLGLSISYGIVQDHGGSISVESVPDRGTTFSITLNTMSGKRSAAKKKLPTAKV